MKNHEFLEQAKAVTNDEFEHFVGANSYKFISTRDKFLQGKEHEWAWMPALFPIYWTAYYKFWGGFFYFMLSVLVATCAAGVPIIVNAIAITSGEEHVEVPSILTGGWYLLCFLIPMIMCGIKMKILYVRHVHRKIISLKTYEDSPEKLQSLLKRSGGTSVAYPSIIFAVMALIFLIPAWLPTEDNIHAAEASANEIIEPSIALELYQTTPFSIAERKLLLEILGGLDLILANVEACLNNPTVVPFIDKKSIEQSGKKLISLDLNKYYGQCYSLSNDEMNSLNNAAKNRLENKENRQMLRIVMELSSENDELLDQLIQRCNGIEADINKVIEDQLFLTESCRTR